MDAYNRGYAEGYESGCGQLHKMQRDIDRLQAKLTRAVEVLKEVEWEGPDEFGRQCPSCPETENYGHADDCKLAAVLRESED